MKTRIVLSTLALFIIASCATPAELTTARAAAVSGVAPCGLWIAATPALAEARHAAAPKSPDMEQFALPGGLSCSAMLAAAPAVEANWGGHAVVYQVPVPLSAAATDETTVEVEVDDDAGLSNNGIGTSPSGPSGLSQF